VGASKSTVIQFIFETALISLFSILLALVIVELTLPHYNDFLNKSLQIVGSQFYLQINSDFQYYSFGGRNTCRLCC
jgi:putative ABC transport system permease protein